MIASRAMSDGIRSRAIPIRLAETSTAMISALPTEGYMKRLAAKAEAKAKAKAPPLAPTEVKG